MHGRIAVGWAFASGRLVTKIGDIFEIVRERVEDEGAHWLLREDC